MTSTRRDGRRLMVLLYATIVGVAGVLGLLLGEYVFAGEEPKLLFLIDLPATALGFATYGMVTVGIGLGIPFALVVYVSRRIGEEDGDTSP